MKGFALEFTGIIAFTMAIALIVTVFVSHDFSSFKTCPAPAACHAPEPCTLQRCTGLTGIAEFLGNYFLCETPDDPSWCYVRELAQCNERCYKFLYKPVSKSRTVLPDAELEVIQTCEAVCKNQLDIFKTNRYFEKKQCEWDPPDPDTLLRIEQGNETIKRLNEDFPYYTLFKHKGRNCYQAFIKDEIFTCMVCVGDTWEQVSADDIYAEANADPFKPRIKRLKVKILEIKEGWVRVKRTYGFPENKDKTTFSIADSLCVQFRKEEK